MLRLQKYKFTFALIFGMLMLMSFSYDYQKDKTLSESFEINGVGYLTIDNLHGDIDIRKWDKNEIKIDVELTVSSKNSRAADQFIEETTVQFSQEDNKVYAITQLAKVNLKKKWWQWGMDNYSFSVNYEVYVPELVHLELENQHGDITVEAYDGDLDLDLAHGSLTTEYITGKTDLKIEHGEVVMKGLSNGKIDIHFSEFETIAAGNLIINSTRTEIDIIEALDITSFSKYDEYKIGSMGNFINEGAYDEIRIGNARLLDITTRFSEINVDVCEVGVNLDLYQGEIQIDHFTPAFDGGTINFEHTEVELSFDSDVILDVDSEHTALDLKGMRQLEGGSPDPQKVRFVKGQSQRSKTLQVKAKYGSLEITD